jgi:hypothetical protein
MEVHPMVNIQKMAEEQVRAERTKYVIWVGKREGFTRLNLYYYPRFVFQQLRWTPVEEVSVLMVNARRNLLLITSPLHPEDADAIKNNWAMFPEVRMYPIASYIARGNPYHRVLCVRTFPKRKTTRLPHPARFLKNYRWVVYERWGKYEGLLISEEPSVVPYACDHASEVYHIVASDEEDILCFTDLYNPNTVFTIPLFYSCL